jgi:hypothetical protein
MLPNTSATASIRALGKLTAYAEANDEDSGRLEVACNENTTTHLELRKITPITNTERSKPWALDDLPKSYHTTGMYNANQNVSIGLGNYQSGVTNRGKMVNYNRVATLLRSIGCMLYGYEEWLASYVTNTPITLDFHLNLDEFGKDNNLRFVTPLTEHMMRHMFIPSRMVRGHHGNAIEQLITTIHDSHHLAHRVPITIQDPDIRIAISELSRESTAKRVMGPLMKAESVRDVSMPNVTLSSFSVLPKPASDRLARTPRNAMLRLLVPWLRVQMTKNMWPHTVSTLRAEDRIQDAANLLLENLDRRIPRLAFQIVKLHTPLNRNIWKILLRWLFVDPTHIPSIPIHDPTSACFASLRYNPKVLLNLFATAYYDALRMTSHFHQSDLLVSANLSALENLTMLRKSLYKRVAEAYGQRYAAKAVLLTKRLAEFDGKTAKAKAKGGTMSRKKGQERKNLVEEIVMYQWRSKAYPKMWPTSESGSDYSYQTYLSLVIEMLKNFARKRKKTMLSTLIVHYEQNTLYEESSLLDALGRLSKLSGLDLITQLHDVEKRRQMTMEDIDRFIVFGDELDVTHAELSVEERFSNSVFTNWTEFGGTFEDSEDDGDIAVLEEKEEAQAHVMGLLMAPMGLKSLKKVTTVYWDIELEEAGYSEYWINLLATNHGLERGTIVEGTRVEELLIELKEIWYPRHNSSFTNLPTDGPDIT